MSAKRDANGKNGKFLPSTSEQIVKPTQKQQQKQQSFFLLSLITELITCWGMGKEHKF